MLIIRCVFADLAYLMSHSTVKNLINQDVYRYLKWKKTKTGKIVRLNAALKIAPFRSVFYYRLSKERLGKKIITKMNKVLLSPPQFY